MSVQVMGLGRQGRAGAAADIVAAWREVGRSGRVAVLIAAVAAVAATLVWVPLTASAWATGAMFAVLLLAGLVDAVEHRLPNPLVLAAAVPVAVAALVALAVGSSVAAGAMVGATAVAVPLFATHLVSPAGLGFGDVKAGTVLGAGLGLLSPVLAPAALVLGLVATAGWAVAGRRRSVPLGPGLVGGGIVAAFAARVAGMAPW